MHKLKNKHTGEVIATPYMAEVEEYLNSGGYEMSDNKIVATISPKDNNLNNKAFDVFEVKETTNAFEGVKCSGESFHCYKDYWSIEFKKPVYTKEMHERGELPPVGSFIETDGVSKVLDDDFSPSSNCVIDLWGSGCVCEVICHTKISGRLLPVVKYKEQVSAIMLSFIKPIPAIEEELCKLVRGYYGGTSKAKDLANEILEKYNITPKEK